VKCIPYETSQAGGSGSGDGSGSGSGGGGLDENPLG